MATFRYVLCDVFTDRPLEGNQLAVFTDARGLEAETMQALALETKLSESVFVLPAEQGGHARIRIFTPTKELQFAGHPTLGAAFVLGGPLQLVEIRLETGAGIVPVLLEREGARIVFGWMEQPMPTWRPSATRTELLAALGVEGAELPVEVYDNGIRARLRRPRLARGGGGAAAGLRAPGRAAETDCVNCFAGDGGEWKTRMFAPDSGVDEDPATGSAAGPLARAPRAARPDRVRRRDRDRAGRRDRAAVGALRAGRRLGRRGRARRGRRLARSSSRAASSGSSRTAPTASISGSSGAQAPPEAAAVAAQVEAVAGGVEDEVGIVLARSRPRRPAGGRRPPRARCCPRRRRSRAAGGARRRRRPSRPTRRRADERQARLERLRFGRGPSARPSTSSSSRSTSQVPSTVRTAAITARASPRRAPRRGARRRRVAPRLARST